jgi:zinc protease
MTGTFGSFVFLAAMVCFLMSCAGSGSGDRPADGAQAGSVDGQTAVAKPAEDVPAPAKAWYETCAPLAVVSKSKFPNGAVRAELSNGMVVVLKEDHGVPLVHVEMWFRAGSIFEEEYLGMGISHFVEHMLFKATENRPVGKVASDVKAAGGTTNAYTTTDRTSYYISGQSLSIEAFIEILADAITNPTFDAAETRKEQEVINNEIRETLDDAGRNMLNIYNTTVYRSSPYRFATIGFKDQFPKLTREDLVKYYHRLYVPNNSIFAIAGDMDIEKTLAMVCRYFSGFERRPLVEIVVPTEPRQLARRVAEGSFPVANPGMAKTRLRMGYRTVSTTHPDMFALDVMSLILGSGESSRLYNTLKQEKKLVSVIGAYSYAPLHEGSFGVYAELSQDKLEAAQKAILAEIERFKTEPVSDKELEKAKNAVIAGYVMGRQTIESQAEGLAWCEYFTRDLGFDETYMSGLKSVKAEDVMRVANMYFNESNLTVVVLKPVKLGGDEPAKTEPGARQAAAVALKVEQAVLPNGIRLVVREDHKLPLVAVDVACMGGTRFDPKGKEGLCNFMGQMLRKGTEKRSAAEIAAEIEQVGGDISSRGGRNSFGASLFVLKEHLDLGLALFADVLLHPSFPKDQMDQMRQQLIFQINSMQEEPIGVDALLFMKLFFKDHPYSTPPTGTVETVQSMTREDLLDFHAKYFVPSNMVISVVGDMDFETAKAKITEAFKSLEPAEVKFPEVVPVPDIASPVTKTKLMKGKQQAALIYGFKAVDMKHEDVPAFSVISSILSGMSGRLWMNLREEKALAYSVFAGPYIQYDPGYFSFGAILDPKNLDAALAGIKQEITLLKDVPVPDAELAKAKNELIAEHLMGTQEISDQATGFALNVLYGLGYDHNWKFPERIRAVTKEDVMRVAKKYFDFEKSILAITKPK